MAGQYVTSLILLDENKILADLNAIAIEMGHINNVFETSRIYVHYAVFARVLGNVTQTVAQYINNLDLETTSDEALLEVLIKPFVKKKSAKVAKVILKFERVEDGEVKENIFIPREMEVMTEGDDPIIFRTAESRILWKNSGYVLIPAYSVEFGALNNLMANTLTYFDDIEFYSSVTVTNPEPAFGGEDEETAFDTRNRIELYRYGKEGTKEALQSAIFANGVSYYSYNLVEYWAGAGSVLVVLDMDSEDFFYDVVQNLEAVKKEGVRYYYMKAEHIYINITVDIKVTGEDMYTEYQQNEIEQNIFTAVQLFFDNQIYIGKNLSKNRLEAYILQYLIDERYDIYETEITIDYSPNVKRDPETKKIIIEPYQRLTPNKVRTKIEYNAE